MYTSIDSVLFMSLFFKIIILMYIILDNTDGSQSSRAMDAKRRTRQRGLAALSGTWLWRMGTRPTYSATARQHQEVVVGVDNFSSGYRHEHGRVIVSKNNSSCLYHTDKYCFCSIVRCGLRGRSHVQRQVWCKCCFTASLKNGYFQPRFFLHAHSAECR